MEAPKPHPAGHARRKAPDAASAHVPDAQQRAEELSLLAELGRIVSATPDLDAAYPIFAEALKKLIPHDLLVVSLLDEAGEHVTVVYTNGDAPPALSVGTRRHTAGRPTEQAVWTKRSLTADYRTSDDLKARFPGSVDIVAEGFHSVLITPVVSRNWVIGLLALHSRAVGAFSSHRVELAEAVASQIAGPMANALLLGEALQRASEEEAIGRVGAAVNGRLGIEGVYEAVARELRSLVPYDRLVIGRLLSDRRQMRRDFVSGVPVSGQEAGTITLTTGADAGFRQRNPDPKTDPVEAGMVASGLRSWSQVYIGPADRPLGILSVRSKRVSAYTPRHLKLLGRVAEHLALALTNTSQLEDAKRLAEERAALAEIALAVNSDLRLATIYRVAAAAIKPLIPYDRLSIVIAAPGGLTGNYVYVEGLDVEGRRVGDATPLGSLNHDVQEPGSRFAIYGTPPPSARVEARNHIMIGLQSFLEVPIGPIDRPLAYLSLRSKEKDAFTIKDGELLLRIGDYLAAAIRNARLLEATQRQAAERSALAEIALAVNKELDIHRICEVVADQVARQMRYDRFVLSRMSAPGGVGERLYVRGRDVPGYEQGTRFTVLQEPPSKRGLLGTAQDPNDVEAFDGAGFRTWAVAYLGPLERPIGAIGIQSLAPNAYSEQDVQFLTLIADQVAQALRNAELLEETRRQSAERAAIGNIGLAINSQQSVLRVCEVVADEMARLIPYDRLVVSRISGGVLGERIYVRGMPIPGRAAGTRFEAMVDASRGRVITGGKGDEAPDFVQHGLVSWMLAYLGPLDAPVGALGIQSKSPGAYSDRDLALIQLIADQLTPALKNSELMETLERRVEERTKELLEANRARSRFFSMVSHELKTPLTSIVGFSELLETRVDNLDERQKRWLRMVRENGIHLDMLVNDLLDISRIDTGRMVINRQPTDICALINELSDSFLPVIAAKKQVLNIKVEPDLTASVDPARLRQVMANLLSNASKYSPPGSEVTIQAGSINEALVIRIADQGLGMTVEERQRLFTPFFRSQSAAVQNEPGTGLGLVIAKGIVELHGGTITVESEQGAGSTFTVDLPMSPDEGRAQPVAGQPEERAGRVQFSSDPGGRG